jgi:hypothetical protein
MFDDERADAGVCARTTGSDGAPQCQPAARGLRAASGRGRAGNAWIPASVYNIILNVVDGGMSAQAAIEAPRLLIGGGGGRSGVQIEDRIPRAIWLISSARPRSPKSAAGEVNGYAAVAVVDAAIRPSRRAEPRRSRKQRAVKKDHRTHRTHRTYRTC